MSVPIPIGVRIVGGTVMLACACAFGAFAIPMLRKSYKRATKGVATSGVVTGSQLQRGSGAAHYSYYPEVEFQTQSGEKISFVASVGSNAEPKLGRKVEVLYFTDNPKDADISSPISSWLFPLFFFLGAIFILLLSLLFYCGGGPTK
jgi:hypothetical protein